MPLAGYLRRPIRIDNGDGAPRYPVKEALAKVRAVIFRGDKIECSCCGRSFSLFMFSPYMASLCPNCLSFERYRLLCRYLLDETNFGAREARLLDIAPTWAFQEFCRRHHRVSYLSIDIRSPLAMRHMDIRALDLPDDHFDILICYHVLEHIDDETKALGELLRVLKPGGRAVIQVPILVEKTVERFELTRAQAEHILKFPDHLRGYGKDFSGKLEAAGFAVEVVPFVKKFSRDEIKRYGLDPTEDLYVCRK
ncbi:MAG: hypothetical protein CVT63_06895 [Candidatus Anoxymicrobium japonicum]|uniref:Methyltransferase type 11 domain-containing protein n=1 Tax=Candidatus Anoxymicrobium japonicum TaxID=2013648 RepID=A0A2N3G4I5_9ACTN|nr:MAG: hypothetical protein CVT63_06895 [Candidatus Anoxymicrobium japonicum]